MIDTTTKDGAVICTRDGLQLADHVFFACCGARRCGPHAKDCKGGPIEGPRIACGTCNGVGWTEVKPMIGEAAEV